MSKEFIKERYCSEEVAKLLANCGFDEVYPKGNCMQFAATQQMAADWIAEKYGFFISPRCFFYKTTTMEGMKYSVTVYDMQNRCRVIETPYGIRSFDSLKELMDEIMEYILGKLIVKTKRQSK